jgi:hypothetical protein
MTKYIDKDAVLAEIKRSIRDNELYLSEPKTDEIRFQKVGAYSALNDLLHFLDTLEVKEVDLEKELETLDSLLYDLDGVAVKGATSYLTVEDVKDIAKHFFELGFKAKWE